MNALNLERCRCIPKNVPGADWRVLQELVAEDPSKELFQVWCSTFSRRGTARCRGTGSSHSISAMWHGPVL